MLAISDVMVRVKRVLFEMSFRRAYEKEMIHGPWICNSPWFDSKCVTRLRLVKIIYIYARWRIYVSADRAIIHVGNDPLHVEA